MRLSIPYQKKRLSTDIDSLNVVSFLMLLPLSTALLARVIAPKSTLIFSLSRMAATQAKATLHLRRPQIRFRPRARPCPARPPRLPPRTAEAGPHLPTRRDPSYARRRLVSTPHRRVRPAFMPEQPGKRRWEQEPQLGSPTAYGESEGEGQGRAG